MFGNTLWILCEKLYGLISVKNFATFGYVVVGSFPQKFN